MGSSLDNLQKDIQELVRRIADLNNHIKKTNDDFDDVSRLKKNYVLGLISMF
jgi:ribosomal protein S15P/S13E